MCTGCVASTRACPPRSSNQRNSGGAHCACSCAARSARKRRPQRCLGLASRGHIAQLRSSSGDCPIPIVACLDKRPWRVTAGLASGVDAVADTPIECHERLGVGFSEAKVSKMFSATRRSAAGPRSQEGRAGLRCASPHAANQLKSPCAPPPPSETWLLHLRLPLPMCICTPSRPRLQPKHTQL